MGIGSQRYTGEVALKRMAEGKCPECGAPGNDHTGWGIGGRCSLTDTGVAQRIDQFERDLAEEAKGG